MPFQLDAYAHSWGNGRYCPVERSEENPTAYGCGVKITTLVGKRVDVSIVRTKGRGAWRQSSEVHSRTSETAPSSAKPQPRQSSGIVTSSSTPPSPPPPPPLPTRISTFTAHADLHLPQPLLAPRARLPPPILARLRLPAPPFGPPSLRFSQGPSASVHSCPLFRHRHWRSALRGAGTRIDTGSGHARVGAASCDATARYNLTRHDTARSPRQDTVRRSRVRAALRDGRDQSPGGRVPLHMCSGA
jgi:hypothetical protein